MCTLREKASVPSGLLWPKGNLFLTIGWRQKNSYTILLWKCILSWRGPWKQQKGAFLLPRSKYLWSIATKAKDVFLARPQTESGQPPSWRSGLRYELEMGWSGHMEAFGHFSEPRAICLRPMVKSQCRELHAYPQHGLQIITPGMSSSIQSLRRRMILVWASSDLSSFASHLRL